jgi:hypothetical protein
MELIIVAPRVAEVCPDEAELSEFAAFQLVETTEIRSTGKSRADGARAATAAVVVFGEDHCWPEPDWAKTLIEAHRQPYGGVGPTLINGNPDNLSSWASFLLNFGPCVDCRTSAVSDYIPTHNSSYKTELLHAYGDRLGFALEVEGLLQKELIAAGYAMFVEAKARTAHVNISTFAALVSEQYWGARFFWAARTRWESWPAQRRWIWAAATPALLVLRLARALKNAVRIGFPARRLPGLFFALTTGAVALTVGAFCGLLFGAREQAGEARVSLEFHRCRYLGPKDKHLLPDD